MDENKQGQRQKGVVEFSITNTKIEKSYNHPFQAFLVPKHIILYVCRLRYLFAHMSVKAWGGGQKALAKNAKNVVFWTAPLNYFVLLQTNYIKTFP